MNSISFTGAGDTEVKSTPLGEARETGVFQAMLIGFDSVGRFQVAFPKVTQPLAALSAIALGEADIGSPVLISFEERHPGTPLIIAKPFNGTRAGVATGKAHPERLVLRAGREIELRCGDASLVLTRAGKVLIKGNFVLTHSRGANRIRGAYVAIN